MRGANPLPDDKRGNMSMVEDYKINQRIGHCEQTGAYEITRMKTRRAVKKFTERFRTNKGDFLPEEWRIQIMEEVIKDVIFRNGYGKKAPQFTAECTIEERTGKPEWGAEEGVVYYVLTIHRIYNLINCRVAA